MEIPGSIRSLSANTIPSRLTGTSHLGRRTGRVRRQASPVHFSAILFALCILAMLFLTSGCGAASPAPASQSEALTATAAAAATVASPMASSPAASTGHTTPSAIGSSATGSLPPAQTVQSGPTLSSAASGSGVSNSAALRGIRPAAAPNLILENYSGGFFTIRKPKSWSIQTTGSYADFGFRMFDPAMPARQVFFYGNMAPFMKSAQARTFWAAYVNSSGFPQARLYSEAPVLSPATTRQFFARFNEFTTIAAKYGIKHSFPSLASFEVLESTPRNSPLASVAKDDSLLRALFVQDKAVCEGQFAAAVVDALQYPVNGLDAGYIKCYIVAGIAAPADEFMHIEKTLAEAIGSFQFTQEYINQGVAQKQWETQAALEAGRTLSQAYDSYNKAWWARQKTYDILSQQRSDATLGYTRLHDPSTGKTYRADAEALAAYTSNPQNYSIQNLQPIPAGSSALYDVPISGYVVK